MSETAAIILAAGKSTRMNSDRPKVLHEVCGRPMLSYVLNACRLAGVDRIAVVVGHGKEAVVDRFQDEHNLVWVEQTRQQGTGHAVLCCRDALRGFSGSVLVIAGDMPLVRRVTLASLVQTRERSGDAVVLATAILEDPSGYGRILRDNEGRLEAIIEDQDCTDEQLQMREVNPSYYCFDARQMFDALEQVKASPETGEYYVTDVIRVLKAAGQEVSASVTIAAEEAVGINSRLDVAAVGRVMEDRIQLALMDDGVTIVDPDNTWIEADASIGVDTTVYPFSFIGVGATIGERCRIGPFAAIGPGEIVPDESIVGSTVFKGVEV